MFEFEIIHELKPNKEIKIKILKVALYLFNTKNSKIKKYKNIDKTEQMF